MVKTMIDISTASKLMAISLIIRCIYDKSKDIEEQLNEKTWHKSDFILIYKWGALQRSPNWGTLRHAGQSKSHYCTNYEWFFIFFSFFFFCVWIYSDEDYEPPLASDLLSTSRTTRAGRRSSSQPPRSSVHYSKYNVPLCLLPTKNFFQLWHDGQ